MDFFWLTLRGDPDKTQAGEGWDGVSQDLMEERCGAACHSVHPAFVDELCSVSQGTRSLR